MIYLNKFFNLKKRIVCTCFLMAVFALFFIALFSYQQAQAKSKTLNLVVGKYECTRNSDCASKGDGAYCDIDNHVCLLQCPEKAMYDCNSDSDCHKGYYCNVDTHTCQPYECEDPNIDELCPEREPGCDSDKDCPDKQKCLNRECVQCIDEGDCLDGFVCKNQQCVRPIKCESNADCPEETPECKENGECGKCPENRSVLITDSATNMRTCVEGCETNEDCKDIQRPFCRLGEGPNGIGKCGCPDKTHYLPEWQTCGYMYPLAVDGFTKKGYKGGITIGGSSGERPFVDASYTFIWADRYTGGGGYGVFSRNGTEVGSFGYYGWQKLEPAYPVYNPGDVFEVAVYNAKKHWEYHFGGKLYFLYKVKKFVGETCVSPQPIMTTDGRCYACDDIKDGTTVVETNHCHICAENELMYSTHSSLTAGDNICRKCASGNNYYYADQEECLSCANTLYKGKDSLCFDCAYTGTVSEITKEECTRCANRKWSETNATTHLGNCTLCTTGMGVDNTGEACSQCNEANPIARENPIANGCINCDNLTAGTRVATREDCYKCGDGVWYDTKSSQTATDHICQKCPEGNTWHIANKSECLTCSNSFWVEGFHYCLSCDYSNTIDAATQTDCHRCTNRTFASIDNRCYPCAYGANLTMTFEECKRCSNRYWVANASGDGYGICSLCPDGATSPDGLTCGCKAEEVVLDNGQCKSCENISDGIAVASALSDIEQRCHACDYMYRSADKKCYDCDRTGEVTDTTKEECGGCSQNRYWVETNASSHKGTCKLCPTNTKTDDAGLSCICDAKHPIAKVNTNVNGCIDCESLTEGTEVASKEECYKCGTQEWFAGHNSQNGTDNRCFKCEEIKNASGGYRFSDREECKKCANTMWRSHDKKCLSCNRVDYWNSMTESECHECPNFLYDKGNVCVACTYNSNRTTTFEECKRCSNRYWVKNTNGDGYGTCKLCASGSSVDGLTCGCQSKEVQTTDGKCTLCPNLTNGTVVSGIAQCHKCNESGAVEWIGTTDNKCYKCSTQSILNVSKTECNLCSNHLWRSSDSTCYTCSYPYKMYNTTKAECDTCPGRTWEETDAENHLGFCWPATK